MKTEKLLFVEINEKSNAILANYLFGLMESSTYSATRNKRNDNCKIELLFTFIQAC